LGLGLALLAEMLDRRVRSGNDLVHLLHVPMLGEIGWGAKSARRAGFLSGPLSRRLFSS
jgi:succinoglycan biosynthesis transport protein ExoP